MKSFFLVGTLFFSIIIMIIAFENLNSSIRNFLFFFIPWTDPFFMVIGIAFLGFVVGISSTMFIVQSLKPDDEEVGSEVL